MSDPIFTMTTAGVVRRDPNGMDPDMICQLRGTLEFPGGCDLSEIRVANVPGTTVPSGTIDSYLTQNGIQVPGDRIEILFNQGTNQGTWNFDFDPNLSPQGVPAFPPDTGSAKNFLMARATFSDNATTGCDTPPLYSAFDWDSQLGTC